MVDCTTDDQRLLDALRLNLIPGVGPRTQEALLAEFGTPAAILAAGIRELQQVEGVGAKLSTAIVHARHGDEPEVELRRCREMGVQLILRGDKNYPRLLAQICDAPPVLYCRGTLEPRDELTVAIVGSRRCTFYGCQQAERLASGLARSGVTIVSGLARGIDAAAHRAALVSKGRTIAVTAPGLADIYPPEHKGLAEEIVQQGALLTESPLDRKPSAGLFPQRNRIISGMSVGVIVVEAARNSGALYTARHAMEQGREVMAVPGRADSLTSEGCHDLIRDGVTLVLNVDDVLKALGPLIEPVKNPAGGEILSPRELTLNPQELEVLNLISIEPTPIDDILRATQLDPSRVLATLTVLEMKRMVRRLPGGTMVRTSH